MPGFESDRATRRANDRRRRAHSADGDEELSPDAAAMLGLQHSAGNRGLRGLIDGSAETAAARVLADDLTQVTSATRRTAEAPGVQREEPRRTAAVDADAQRIIDLAQDASKPMDERAVAVVRAIVRQYFAGDASKISGIVYSQGEGGLHVFMSGKGADTVGRIEVGDSFVNQTTQAGFARRVAQVHHEIEHVDQQRAGRGGANRQDEREFEAFYHEALFAELAGTGRISHSTRVQLIDGALGYLCCLSEDLQKTYAAQKDELLKRREQELKRTGHAKDFGPPPTTCRRQAD